MLKDASRTIKSMCTANGNPRSSNVIRNCILTRLSDLLADIETHLRGYGSHVDFSKGQAGGGLSGFFTEDGII